MKKVRVFTKEDKLLLAIAFLNAGIKARMKMLNFGVRVVFEGPQSAVMAVLNAEGFLSSSGEAFGVYSFQGNQAFVRYVA